MLRIIFLCIFISLSLIISSIVITGSVKSYLASTYVLDYAIQTNSARYDESTDTIKWLDPRARQLYDKVR